MLRSRSVALMRLLALGLLGGAVDGCAAAQMRRGGYLDFIRPDQHPPLVGAVAAADSLWGPAVQSERGDGIAESRRANLEALVHRFAPTLVLPKNDHATANGRRYQLQPTDVALFTDTLRLDVMRAAPYQVEDSLNISFRTVSLDSLARLVSQALRYESAPELIAAWYFDFPGGTPREWWEVYGRLRSGPDSARWAAPTVYAHPFVEPTGRVAIQYWFFYPFNDFVGNHEGDWEHINVVLTQDRQDIAEVHYYFHARSIRLPQGKYRPEIVDGTHPVVYAGGRMYNIFDYPIRFVAGERNSGSHGVLPYPGEWEGAGGLGAPESVGRVDRDSVRVVRHKDFRVVLTPEPSRIDFLRHTDGLREWAWLLLPVRWGFPSVTSLGSELKSDVGNRAPFGPAFLPAWNRTAPGLLFPGYQVRRISTLRSFAEDLVQPWYYLYIFRTPRYVHDVRVAGRRDELVHLGLVPRSGFAERGFGTPTIGLHFAYPDAALGAGYRKSPAFALWRNFWMKIRFGMVEVLGGYQKFRAGPSTGRDLFVYPFTAGIVLRTPDALLRPYIAAGGGLYGWQARGPVTSGADYQAWSGWSAGWTAAAGVEYYLRPKVALDVGVRLHSTRIDGAAAGLTSNRVRFFALWIGHYVRF